MHRVIVFLKVLLALSSALYCNPLVSAPANDERFAGAESCRSCHQAEFQQWQGSHHDLAMQHANKDSVLGDFSGVTFNDNGITSTFFKKGEEFWVNTDGPDGKLADYKISFTFGVDPLQQYLVAFEDGRLQTLSLAWDSRTAEEGGQRWFHLYADEQVHSGDILHWTRASQTWNLQCADCHSTNLKKNYDRASDSYQTSWYEINVACEACHGPGAAHVGLMARNNSSVNLADTSDNLEGSASQRYQGFDRRLSPVSRWMFEEGKVTATNTLIDKNSQQIQSCAGCHSRRSQIAEESGGDFLDEYIPALLEPGLYHTDGQILDEVYVYGSFTQSKMHTQGVACSNCHNPHTLEIKAPGNQVCAQCHLPSVFDTPQHHHHPIESTGTQCVNCHMPETTYMTVDPRRDHSIRIPRPEISQQFGAPNACNQCHTDESADWAVENFQSWYGDKKAAKLSNRQAVHAFDAAINNPEESVHRLQNIAFDDEQALMTRASALARMAVYPSQDVINSAIKQLESEDALVRYSAAGLFELLPPEQRPAFLIPALKDPVKAVRLEAARLLAGSTQSADLSSEDNKQLLAVIKEYETALKINEDIPAGVSQLGQLYLAQGKLDQAEQAYLHALKLEPLFIPARLNLADIYRAKKREDKALNRLKEGLKLIPEQVDFSFALGLSHIRQQRIDLAIPLLKAAADNAPENARYSYVFAVALFDSGEREQAIDVLKASLHQHPQNRDILSALASYLQSTGRRQEAVEYLQKL